jgi:hypothetical protein
MPAQGFPQDVDVLNEAGLVDEALRPDAVRQFALRARLAGALDKRRERLHDLRTQRHLGAVAGQARIVGIEPEWTEGIRLLAGRFDKPLIFPGGRPMYNWWLRP